MDMIFDLFKDLLLEYSTTRAIEIRRENKGSRTLAALLELDRDCQERETVFLASLSELIEPKRKRKTSKKKTP